MVGEDRVELSPRVPKTRMLALHHTPTCKTGAPGETRTHASLLKRQVPLPVGLLTHFKNNLVSTAAGLPRLAYTLRLCRLM